MLLLIRLLKVVTHNLVRRPNNIIMTIVKFLIMLSHCYIYLDHNCYKYCDLIGQ